MTGCEREEERGVILEIHGRDAVVLTRSGEFRQVRLDRLGCRVGEETLLPAARRQAPAWSGASLSRGFLTVAAMAAALALVLLPGSLLRSPASPGGPGSVSVPAVLAYVSVDINPSVELGVDASGNVVAAQALNADAAALIQRVDYAGRPVADVIAALARAAAENGYLAPGRENAVVIAAVPAAADAPLPEAVQRQVDAGRRQVEAVLAERSLKGQVGVLQARAPELRQSADQAGLSVGKYLILLEARKAGIEATAEEIRTQPVGRFFQERGVKPGEIIRRASEEEDFLALSKQYEEHRANRDGGTVVDGPTAVREGDSGRDSGALADNGKDRGDGERANPDSGGRSDGKPSAPKRSDSGKASDGKDGRRDGKQDGRRDGKASENGGDATHGDDTDGTGSDSTGSGTSGTGGGGTGGTGGTGTGSTGSTGTGSTGTGTGSTGTGTGGTGGTGSTGGTGTGSTGTGTGETGGTGSTDTGDTGLGSNTEGTDLNNDGVVNDEDQKIEEERKKEEEQHH